MIAREVRILDSLGTHGSVQVTELAREFDVSEVTIRKDLDALASRQLLRRTRGGALPPERGDEGTFHDRLQRASTAKRAVARQAATLVEDGDVIALDTSTTSHYLALELTSRRGLVVVTQSLPTATMLMDRSDARIVMPGGTLRRESSGLVGPNADALAGRGRVRKAFFGVVGLSTARGLLELATDEVVSKQALVAVSNEVHGLFDSSKVDGFALHSFAAADRVTSLITDAGASDEFVDEWQSIGVPVTRATIPDQEQADVVSAPAQEGKGPRRPTARTNATTPTHPIHKEHR